MTDQNAIQLKKGQKGYITAMVNLYKATFDYKTAEALSQAKELRNYYNTILISSENNKSLRDKINDLEQEINFKAEGIGIKINELESFYNKVFISNDEHTSLQEELDKYIEDIDEKTTEFNKYCDQVFGIKNEEGKRVGGGLKQELETRRKEYDALYKKIEGLLPGATSAGLAHAYQAHKNTFKRPKFIWQGVFVTSLVGMCVIIVCYKPDLGPVSIEPLRRYLYSMLFRIPLIFPLIWLAVFASKQQSKAQRLEQEYAYKEVLSRSFEGYYREIEKLSESEHGERLSIALLEKVVEMSGYNPSQTLDNISHDEKPPITDDIKNGVMGIVNGAIESVKSKF